MKNFLYWLGGLLPCRIIDGPRNESYLERYFMFKLFRHSFYLHRLVGSDPDRGLHDHPWGWAASFVLFGGYHELRLAGWDMESRQISIFTRYIKRWRLNFIKGDDYHRILLDENKTVWTLFVHGPRRKGWGFLEYSSEIMPPPLPSRHVFVQYRPYVFDRRWDEQQWWRYVPRGHQLQRTPL